MSTAQNTAIREGEVALLFAILGRPKPGLPSNLSEDERWKPCNRIYPSISEALRLARSH